jgi:hypothetical protein
MAGVIKTRRKTCGEFYREAISGLATEPEYWAFEYGFVSGQAEKVYLGACTAAMFRPSDEKRKRLMRIVRTVCRRYGLAWTVVGEDEEVWICRAVNVWRVRAMKRYEKNSPQWHEHRAEICGVPVPEIDLEFHERQGYGKKCD